MRAIIFVMPSSTAARTAAGHIMRNPFFIPFLQLRLILSPILNQTQDKIRSDCPYYYTEYRTSLRTLNVRCAISSQADAQLEPFIRQSLNSLFRIWNPAGSAPLQDAPLCISVWQDLFTCAALIGREGQCRKGPRHAQWTAVPWCIPSAYLQMQSLALEMNPILGLSPCT